MIGTTDLTPIIGSPAASHEDEVEGHVNQREIDYWDDLVEEHQDEIFDHAEDCTKCKALLDENDISDDEEDDEEYDDEDMDEPAPVRYASPVGSAPDLVNTLSLSRVVSILIIIVLAVLLGLYLISLSARPAV